MPEDQEYEEISEQEPDPDAEAGFNEFSAGEYQSDDDPGDPELEDPKDPAGEKDEGKPDKDEKPSEGDKPSEEEAPKLTAKEAIEKRAAELEKASGGDPDKEKPAEQEPEDKKGAPDDKPSEPAKPESQKPGRLTKEQIQAHLNVISDDELPDGEIVIGDNTFNFAELKEDDPEAYNAMKVMSSLAGAKYLQAAVNSGKLVTADSVQQMRDSYDQAIGNLSLKLDLISNGHGDFDQVIRSGEYKQWIDSQPKGIKMMASSPDVEDAIKVLDYYKESVAQKKADDHDGKLKDKKKRKDNLLKGTINSKPAGPEAKTESREDEAAFNEAAAIAE